MERKTRIFAVVLGFMASSLAIAAPASADFDVQISGWASPGTHGPGAFTTEYDIAAGGDLPAAVVTTHQDAALPALMGGVTLDGVAVPESQVSSPDAGDISVALGADPSDTLSMGRHTLTFTVTVASGDTTDTSSAATITWGASGSATSYPLNIEVNQPDVYSEHANLADDALPASMPASTASTHRTQRSGSFAPATIEEAFMVSNAGWGAPQTQVEVKVPKDLTITKIWTEYVNDTARTKPVAAVHDATVNLGPIYHYQYSRLIVTLQTTRQERIGHKVTVRFIAHLLPGQGTDANPANNIATASFTITGAAALTEHIAVPRTHIQVGDRLKVTERIHNGGPNTAVATSGTVIADRQHFRMISFSGREGKHNPYEMYWRIGRLPPGHSATAVLIVKAIHTASKKHPARLTLYGGSHNVNPRCPDGYCGVANQSITIGH